MQISYANLSFGVTPLQDFEGFARVYQAALPRPDVGNITPVLIEDDAYVFAHVLRSIRSAPAPFREIRERVADDFRRNRQHELLKRLGVKLPEFE